MKAKYFGDGVLFGQDCFVTVHTRGMEAAPDLRLSVEPLLIRFLNNQFLLIFGDAHTKSEFERTRSSAHNIFRYSDTLRHVVTN